MTTKKIFNKSTNLLLATTIMIALITARQFGLKLHCAYGNYESNVGRTVQSLLKQHCVQVQHVTVHCKAYISCLSSAHLQPNHGERLQISVRAIICTDSRTQRCSHIAFCKPYGARQPRLAKLSPLLCSNTVGYKQIPLKSTSFIMVKHKNNYLKTPYNNERYFKLAIHSPLSVKNKFKLCKLFQARAPSLNQFVQFRLQSANFSYFYFPTCPK